ncbi:MAG: TonB-dependent receptor [bacterium]|nr:TonB-dependent receptor [bacterium]
MPTNTNLFQWNSKHTMHRFYCFLGWFLAVSASISAQDYSYQQKALLEVIRDIETQTEYRFLYREALVASITLSFDADRNELFDALESAIVPIGLGLKVDSERKQAIIYKTGIPTESLETVISGFIVDENSGERLPYATISWREQGEIRGVNSDESGRFRLSASISQPSFTLLISYVGYASQTVTLSQDETSKIDDLTVRLRPKKYDGKEIIVQGVNFYTPNDTLLHGLMKIGSFSPLGESNAVRSLQTLPAVSLNTAINDGINIRGSASDGFQVLLDGQTLYSQSHLFGLLDAMNSEVLRSSGFYYDITPAQYQAPLGGTLSLITRTGSLNQYSTSVGVSNTAFSSTIEGPIKRGSSSFLLSGRWSYLDELDWFNNASMIEYGLDVDRPLDLFVDPRLENRFVREVTLDKIDVQSTNASFYDLHGKLYTEFRNGNHLMISGYLGNDEARQDYLRDETNTITLNETSNNWENHTISATFSASLLSKLFSQTSIGYTKYSSDYLKDDFAFPVRGNSTNGNGILSDSVLIQPLNLDNTVKQIEIKQDFSAQLQNGTANFGINYTDFNVRYTEIGIIRESFISRRTSQLVDLYSQWDQTLDSKTSLSLGSRLHYFSNGQYLRFSPRIKLSIQESEALRLGLGFSRNYQFINRLTFYNINSNDFWILANEDQPPSSVNHFSTGIYYRFDESTYFQIEGYLKQFANIRLHELNTGLVSQSFRNEESPWFYQNDGRSQGVEFLLKNWFSDVTLTNTYTYSSAELKNQLINNGEYFYADWDRRHQITTSSDITLHEGLNLLLAWTFGTGTPSRTDISRLSESAERLPNYSRFDISLNYKKVVNKAKLEAAFSIYNAFNRDNVWYSERKQVTINTLNNTFQGAALTHVYDLGIQPSFSIKISY